MSNINDLYHFIHEIEFTTLLKKVTESLKIYHELILKNGNVIDIQTGNTSITSVRIRDGIIVEVGEDLQEAVNVPVIDCTDRFIIPGLIDMHVHLDHGNSQHLLHLVNGITTVREMCGFPGVLSLRDEIRKQNIIAPDVFVASTMLNDFQMSRYTYAISHEDTLRSKIREFKEIGYDYLKIWNVITSDHLEIIFDEAKKLDFPVVGHIPHQTEIQYVLSKGMRTLEHLKGYIEDSTMKLTEEDYLTLTPKTGNWNCPTLLIHFYDSLIGHEAQNFLNSNPSVKYISRYKREKWKNEIENKTNSVLERGFNIPKINSELQEKVFQNLIEKDIELISGTDMGGGFIFGVPGIGLIDELLHMNNLGLSKLRTLQSSTINSAKALTDETDRGEVKTGMRGDLLILENNPINDLNNLKASFDVVFSGRYITNDTRNDIKQKIKNISNSQPEGTIQELLEQIFEFYLNEKLHLIRPLFIDPIIPMVKDEKMKSKLRNRSFEYSNNTHDKSLN